MSYRVYFVDDAAEATVLSGPLETREEAKDWEKRYWRDYFDRHPGAVLYYCSTEIREENDG